MNESIVGYISLNSITINTYSLNVAAQHRSKDKPAGYGVNNWLFDDGQNVLWDNNGLVLTDK